MFCTIISCPSCGGFESVMTHEAVILKRHVGIPLGEDLPVSIDKDLKISLASDLNPKIFCKECNKEWKTFEELKNDLDAKK